LLVERDRRARRNPRAESPLRLLNVVGRSPRLPTDTQRRLKQSRRTVPVCPQTSHRSPRKFRAQRALALIVIIRRGEHLPMHSIGLGTARWWKSILCGFIIAIVSAVTTGALAYLTGYGRGSGSAAFEKLPLWLITAIVFRAGVVEELFYRGYAIERLRMIGVGRFWSVAIPLVIFSLGHWTGGAANILIAFAAGLILTGFYLWRRDLAANMIEHGPVDFVANVLPKLFSRSS
jgi:uncharacterized protein